MIMKVDVQQQGCGASQWSPTIDVKYAINAIFGHQIWKAIPPEASQRGRPKLERTVRVCSITPMLRPLPVIYTYGLFTLLEMVSRNRGSRDLTHNTHHSQHSLHSPLTTPTIHYTHHSLHSPHSHLFFIFSRFKKSIECPVMSAQRS